KYRLLVLPVESVAKVAGKIMSILRAAALDGVILTPPASDHPQVLSELTRHNFPFSRVAPTESLEYGPSRTTDDVEAARK
ncbi:alanine racemase, partial [Sphingopyxis sp. BSNA05]|nr:alanine racemase [Sphingopyxis sp. BSNA05]